MNKRKKCFSGFLFLVALCLGGCTSNCEIHEQRARLAMDSLQYEDALAHALEFYRCADGDSAAKALRSEVERAVQFNDHLEAASEFRDSSDFDRELQELILALEIDTTEYLLSRLSEVQEGLELWEGAIESCSLAIHKGYSLYDNFIAMAALYDNWERSNRKIEKGGSSRGQDRLREKQLNYLNAAIELQPKDYFARLKKKKVLYNLGRSDEAMTTVNSLRKEYPDSLLQLEFAWCKYGVRDYTGAVDEIRSYLEHVDDSVSKSDAYILLGHVEKDRGSHWSSVDRIYSKALDLILEKDRGGDKHIFWLTVKARALDENGQHRRACEDYRSAADLGATWVYDRIREICQ